MAVYKCVYYYYYYYLIALTISAAATASAKIANAFASKGIIQSPINSILKICGRRQCGLSAAKGWLDCTARAKSDIYDCLVIPCGLLHDGLCRFDTMHQCERWIDIQTNHVAQQFALCSRFAYASRGKKPGTIDGSLR